MNKIAVIGVGHLGTIHLKCIHHINIFNLVGFYDVNEDNARKIVEEFGIKRFLSIEELLDATDIVDIVAATTAHYDIAKQAIMANKHVFIEKPVTATLEQAENLLELIKIHAVKVQVGHVERFNPAFTASLKHIHQPMFIEGHRLAFFNPRGNDVSVVLDLMIHDIDIVMSLVNSPLKAVHSSGVPIVTETPDIANARLEFENGCVVNLTASRLSLKNMRKMRVFQKNAYISMDFMEAKSNVVSLKSYQPEEKDPFAMIIDLGKTKKRVYVENMEVIKNNAIEDELTSFYQAIKDDKTPVVTLQDGVNALRTAFRIKESMNKIL